jgi:hypothetical protein
MSYWDDKYLNVILYLFHVVHVSLLVMMFGLSLLSFITDIIANDIYSYFSLSLSFMYFFIRVYIPVYAIFCL